MQADTDIVTHSPVERVLMLRNGHDRTTTSTAIGTGLHTFSSCFTDDPYHAGNRLTSGNLFCTPCLSQRSTAVLRAADLSSFSFPATPCRRPVNLHNVLSLLPKDIFDLWDALVLLRRLNTMSDIGQCSHCAVHTLLDGDFGLFPHCFFSFCTLCCQGLQPGVQCLNTEQELAAMKKRSEQVERASKPQRCFSYCLRVVQRYRVVAVLLDARLVGSFACETASGIVFVSAQGHSFVRAGVLESTARHFTARGTAPHTLLPAHRCCRFVHQASHI
jgi:hypothetical protein